MSNSKRLPRGGQPGTYTRHARGRHRRPSRTDALGSQMGATILAAGLAGAVLAIPATANAATGSGGSAGAGNTNTGAAVPVPAITDAQVLASAGPPVIFYKAPPASGVPASPAPVPLPMPRPTTPPARYRCPCPGLPTRPGR